MVASTNILLIELKGGDLSEKHKEYRREIARKNRNDHYDKIFARSVIKNLPKEPCEKCDSLEVEAHMMIINSLT